MPPANDDYRKRLAERKRLLSRASQKQKREKAFSTPAPARFGVEIDTKQDRVTDFDKPFEAPLLTNNQTAKTIDRFSGQMARRYTINPIKSARDVAVDTVTGGKDALKMPPWLMYLIPGMGVGGAIAQYNLLTNEKVSDVLAPGDVVGSGSVARGIGKAAVSKGGKALLGAIGAGLGFGAANEDEAEAAPFMGSAIKSIGQYGGKAGIEILGTGERIRFPFDPSKYNLTNEQILKWIDTKVKDSKDPVDRAENLLLRVQALGRIGGHSVDDPNTAKGFVDLISGKDTHQAVSLANEFLLRPGRAAAEDLVDDATLNLRRIRSADYSAAKRLADKAGTSMEDIMARRDIWSKSDLETSLEQLKQYAATGSGFTPERVHVSDPLSLARGHFSTGRWPTVMEGSNILNALGNDLPFIEAIRRLSAASGGKLSPGELVEYTGDIINPYFKLMDKRKRGG